MRSARRRLVARRAKTAADSRPPACPDGWRTGPPDFVGVGVQRAGTSWWFEEICRHPGVRRLPEAPKELHFFDAFSDRHLTDADIERYHAWFPRPEGGTTGEWTPVYSYDPWSVPLLARAAPDARILLMLRDPLDRFRSGLLFRLRRGHSHADAVRDAFQRGLYASQVARLLDHVTRERLLVLTFEEARTETSRTLRRTLEHLQLDPDRIEAPAPPQRPHDHVAEISRALPSELLEEIAARYRQDVAALLSMFPEIDLSRWQIAGT
jgi:hypothetical protein